MNHANPTAFDQALNKSIAQAAKTYQQERPGMMQSLKKFLRNEDAIFAPLAAAAACASLMIGAACYGQHLGIEAMRNGLSAPPGMGRLAWQALSNIIDGKGALLDNAKVVLEGLSNAHLTTKLAVGGLVGAYASAGAALATKVGSLMVGEAPDRRAVIEQILRAGSIDGYDKISSQRLEEISQMNPLKRLLTVPSETRRAASMYDDLKQNRPDELARINMNYIDELHREAVANKTPSVSTQRRGLDFN